MLEYRTYAKTEKKQTKKTTKRKQQQQQQQQTNKNKKTLCSYLIRKITFCINIEFHVYTL